MFALADCNNFFVSCERVFRPDLERSPVLVLSNNDGCVISRSNEVKALGVKMGVPVYQIRDAIERNHITVFSSNFTLYGDMSDRVHLTLLQMVPDIEIYSIDEAFLDLRGMENTDMDLLAKKISKTCRRNTGIPVSVGVAPTKTLAKIASKLCKTYPKLQGGCYMNRPEDIEKVLKKFPVNDVWGIGRKHNAFLSMLNIKSAADFAALNPEFVEKQFSITGLRTWRELHGEPCIGFTNEVPAKQQICSSRSFSKEIYELEPLCKQVSLFVSMVCEKLRKQGGVCNQAMVFVLTNRHRQNLPQQFEEKMVTFQVATDSTLEINAAIMKALPRLFRKGYGYKKAGVILSEISSGKAVQSALFDAVDHGKHGRAMKAMDYINAKEGKNKVAVASQDPEGIRMNRNHLSPQYTTKWSDILVVNSG
ncbi:MAG: Y-family DNA polymerase [Bacteroidales bacterium]|jgi:DNA polymerase V|nr:Y-family DNA polymerase [Bacteroidales bacterium]MCI2122436.1 Y-family DNA polymerase [Bacteroidales bacterium]MCI2145942.1 Y-family DNA polymerase [Bacteroidales bacterium]